MGPTVPFWCVDAGDDALTALRVRRTADNALEVMAAWTLPLRTPPGEHPARAAAALLSRRGLRGHGIHLLLPGRGASFRSSRIAPEDADMTAREMERDLFDLTSMESDEAVLRWRRLGGPEVLDFRVLAERKVELETWRTAMEEAGFLHVGLGLAPAAILTALETFRVGPRRGYLLEVRGSFSCLTAIEGALSVRHPIPFGFKDIAARLGAAGGAVTLDQALDGAPGTPAAAALGVAAAPLIEDLRRSLDFHRAAVPGTGDERLLFLGPAALRPGLRALLSSAGLAPLADLPDAAALQGVRLGDGLEGDGFSRALPAFLAPLGGALTASGLSPRDLDIQALPDDLPLPMERTLFPLASALLVLLLAVSWVMARETLDTLTRGRRALASLPAPPTRPGPLDPAEAVERVRALTALAESARERAALRRALTDLLGAIPRAEAGGAADGAPPGGFPPWGTEGFQVMNEGGNYRVRARLRPAPSGEGSGAPPRMEPLVRALEEQGWRVTGSSGGVLSAEILQMKRGGR